MVEAPAIEPLCPEARGALLLELAGWRYDADRRALFRSIRLGDFGEAMALIVRIAIEAEKADHHPEWSNVYNRIDLWLTTHDAGDVSDRDARLARVIDKML